MLHRFHDRDLGNTGAHDPALVRRSLGYLRHHRFELIPLATLFERARNGEPLKGAIAFTIDDGYRDHATIGAQLFTEFDCPVTTFVTTGFLDGDVWFWWDQIEYVFLTTRRSSLTVSMRESTGDATFELRSPSERDEAQESFTAACKPMSQAEKMSAIARLAEAAEVEIPHQPPVAYAPMSWDDARRCERSGMSFGPHSVSHPILARTPDEQSRFEIEESWRRVSTEVAAAVPIFCYPNGQNGDFGARETRTIDELGLIGAVAGSTGYASGAQMRDARNRFHVHRFALPPDRASMVQYVTGLEQIKARIRSRTWR